MNFRFKLFSTIFLLISACSISSGVTARSCSISESSVHEWSQKYKKLVHINTQKHDDEYMVEISFPARIDGLEFKSISLFKGEPAYDATKMDHDFFMQLGTWEGSKDTVHSVYAVKSFLAEDHYLSISYDKDCGMYVQYRVEFK